MTARARSPSHRAEDAPRAPGWHLAALVALIVAVAVTGAVFLRAGTNAPPGAGGVGSRLYQLYLPSIVVEWSLVVYVARVGRGRSRLRELVGALPSSVTRAAADVALGLAGWAIVELAEVAASRVGGGAAGARSIVTPGGPLERIVWCVFALSAGFCEEVVYRGYLRTELGARTRPAVGVFLQAMLFGVAHLDQGASRAARVALYGLGLGVLARARGSLVAGIVCHVAVDATRALWSG